VRFKMPIQREHVQFAVLFLSVPLQLMLSSYMGSNEASRTYAISKLVNQFSELRESYLRLDSWKTWCKDIIKNQLELNFRGVYRDEEDPNGECPAVEVFKFRDENGFFGQSPEPRETRPPHVKYSRTSCQTCQMGIPRSYHWLGRDCPGPRQLDQRDAQGKQ